MKCPSCNKIINKTDNICHHCGKSIKEKSTNKWIIISIILSFIVILETSLLIWNYVESQNKIKPNLKILRSPIKKYDINETFTFEGLEITIKDDYSITELENKYSMHNGKNVIVIPVNIKNILEEKNSLNLYYYTIYDPNDNEIDEVAGYFYDALYYEGELKPNQSHIKYLYPLYMGNGTYTIKFDNGNERVIIKYDIKKEIELDNQDIDA